MTNDKSKASQDFVPIKEIRDNLVTLKDGGIRAVLMVSSINFALKDNEERQATLFQFQDFLNSLDFSVQIHIQARHLDIKPYLSFIREQGKEQTNELLRIQTYEYASFIEQFTDNFNIMTTNFFVVVPYNPHINSSAVGHNPLKMFKKTGQNETSSNRERINQLEHRIGIVRQGLFRSGLRAEQLQTEELVEFYHQIFNPKRR